MVSMGHTLTYVGHVTKNGVFKLATKVLLAPYGRATYLSPAAKTFHGISRVVIKTRDPVAVGIRRVVS